jgi:ABC-type transporter Mla subunit MlaD
VDGPIEDAWRAQQEAAARFTEVWRELLGSAAGLTTSPGTPAGVEDRVQALTRSAADFAAAALQPLRDLVDGQRQFADQMTRWAELQRDLADNVASWAARQREYADTLDRLLSTFLPRSESSTEQASDREDR